MPLIWPVGPLSRTWNRVHFPPQSTVPQVVVFRWRSLEILRERQNRSHVRAIIYLSLRSFVNLPVLSASPPSLCPHIHRLVSDVQLMPEKLGI